MQYAKRAYVHRYTVQGRGDFPLDMLRWDASYPASESDALAAAQNARFRHVTLEHVDTRRDWTPSKGRWASFLWRPIDQKPPRTMNGEHDHAI